MKQSNFQVQVHTYHSKQIPLENENKFGKFQNSWCSIAIKEANLFIRGQCWNKNLNINAVLSLHCIEDGKFLGSKLSSFNR